MFLFRTCDRYKFSMNGTLCNKMFTTVNKTFQILILFISGIVHWIGRRIEF